jgi:hypothetical protein
VDGTVVVKDIYYGGIWRTVALVGLGRGGQSYFALDISNPTAPTHLFTIENDDFRQVVNFWNSSGTKTSPSSPLVQVTKVTFAPAAMYFAMVIPEPMVSSSG